MSDDNKDKDTHMSEADEKFSLHFGIPKTINQFLTDFHRNPHTDEAERVQRFLRKHYRKPNTEEANILQDAVDEIFSSGLFPCKGEEESDD